MNEKISITIDGAKIPKNIVKERRWTNNQGHEVISRDLKLDIVPLKEPKKIKEGDTWEMWKTHFVAIPQSKEDKESKLKSVIVGDGLIFKQKKVEAEPEVEMPYPTDDVNPADIPF